MVTEASAPIAGPSSHPSHGTGTQSKNKRKRPVAETTESSSSTRNTDQDRHSKRKKKSSKGKDKGKEKRKIAERNGSEKMKGSFDTTADFIALLDSDGDDPRDEDKGKGKQKEKEKEQEKGEKSRKGKDRERTPERDWDRGKRRDRDRDRRRHDQPSASVRPIGDRKLPWFKGLDLSGCHNVAELLHKEVEAFTKWISPSPVEDEIRGLLVDHIKFAITSRFRDAQVFPFGSYATKLYLPTGDIDLVVMSETMRVTDKHVVLRSLAEVIKRNRIASNVSIIAKARVPIIKFVTTLGHIPVDISINQGNGTVGANVVNGFLQNMTTTNTTTSSSSSRTTNLEGSVALRALVMITKMFLSQRSMNEVYTGGLGSYSIVSLVISFLQMHPKIRRGEIDADQNLGVLLIEFFELYGSYFNYDNVGISVRDGGTYYNKRQRGWYNDSSNFRGKGGGGGSMLSIEDPIDISNDVSTSSYAFPKVRATFAGAHQILTATAYLKAGILSAYQSGQQASFRREDYHPEEMSILSHIIDVTQDIINHRRVVQEVYDKRILHDLLGVNPKVIVMADSSHKSTSSSRAVNGIRHHHVADEVLEDGEIFMALSSEPDVEDTVATRGSSVPATGRRRRRGDSQSSTSSREADSDNDDSGKYGIRGTKERREQQQPPRKRQRTGGPMDGHTVFTAFTTDDEDGDDSAGATDVIGSGSDSSEGSDSDSLAREEEEYDIDIDWEEDDRIDHDADAGKIANMDRKDTRPPDDTVQVEAGKLDYDEAAVSEPTKGNEENYGGGGVGVASVQEVDGMDMKVDAEKKTVVTGLDGEAFNSLTSVPPEAKADAQETKPPTDMVVQPAREEQQQSANGCSIPENIGTTVTPAEETAKESRPRAMESEAKPLLEQDIVAPSETVILQNQDESEKESVVETDEKKKKLSSKSEKKRSYWLSKGISGAAADIYDGA